MCVFVFFFFKQKTAYEMRISDWSSDVCSSDLYEGTVLRADYRTFAANVAALAHALGEHHGIVPGDRVALFLKNSSEYLELFYAIWWVEIGRASCRERVCQYV